MTEFTGEVHPLADALPMLPSDELADLAQDIKENGLLDPLTLDADGRLIDGRNRLTACDMAGVKPTFVVFTGDPEALVLSRGGRRRNITAGQRAMLTARVMWNRGLWDGEKWSESKSFASANGVGKSDLSMCGVILAHSTDLAADVLGGTVALRAAYDQAQDAKKAKAETDRQLATLADDAPDLYRRTQDGDPIEETWAAYLVRTKEQRERAEAERQAIRNLINDAHLAFTIILGYRHPETVRKIRANWEPQVRDWTADDLRNLASILTAVSDTWENPA